MAIAAIAFAGVSEMPLHKQNPTTALFLIRHVFQLMDSSLLRIMLWQQNAKHGGRHFGISWSLQHSSGGNWIPIFLMTFMFQASLKCCKYRKYGVELQCYILLVNLAPRLGMLFNFRQ